jgi:abnormal spindle-like microcephaly-associated protein
MSHSVMGTGGGKENVLPGALLSRNAKGEKPLVKSISKAAPLGSSKSQSSLQQTTNIKKRSAPELKDAPKPKVQARALHERSSIRNEVLPRPANLDPFSRDFKHKPLPAPRQASKPLSDRPRAPSHQEMSAFPTSNAPCFLLRHVIQS